MTKETVLALADRYRKACEAKLDFKSKRTIDEINRKLALSKSTPVLHKRTIDELVNQLTIALAGLKNFDTLTVASAILVQTAPGNPRTANLIASVLHTSDRLADAVIVFEYTLSLKPDSTLAMLNLANAYLDVNEDEKAKALADKVVFKESDNMAAHRVLATYWYRKNNMGRFGDELLKASKFKGYVKKKTDSRMKKIKEVTQEEGDSIDVLEQKVKKLEDVVPWTTADIIEEDFPSQAQQIRDKYGKLQENEKMIMPKLPQVNMTTPQDYQRNYSIILAWAHLFDAVVEKYMRGKARAAAMLKAEQMTRFEAWQSFQDLKNMPGVNQAELAKATATLNKMMQERGNRPEGSPASTPSQTTATLNKMMQEWGNRPEGSPASIPSQATATLNKMMQEQGNRPEGSPASTPSLSFFNDKGYSGDYMLIHYTYEAYITKAYTDFDTKVRDIIQVYTKKVQVENDKNKSIMEQIEKDHKAHTGGRCGCELLRKKERLRNLKVLNTLAVEYYQSWVNLYAPFYTQKMKPAMDGYWKTCMLFVRNMSDPRVMEREYFLIRDRYLGFVIMGSSGIRTGATFQWLDIRLEEEALTEAEKAAAAEAEKEARSKMEKEFREPETDWTKWIEDHLEIEIAGEFLGLKVTATTIEFEAYALGPGAGIKADFVNEKLETYISVGAKFDVGVKIGGINLGKIDARVDTARRVSSWDFLNGTYAESYGAKGEAKFGVGSFTVGGEVELDTELNAKATGKITAGDKFTYKTDPVESRIER
jgi:tetratricopeptide (TPR) repeat protein